jgi:hypothetical protein
MEGCAEAEVAVMEVEDMTVLWFEKKTLGSIPCEIE